MSLDMIYTTDGVKFELIESDSEKTKRLENTILTLSEEIILLKKQLRKSIQERDMYKLYVPNNVLTLGGIADKNIKYNLLYK